MKFALEKVAGFSFLCSIGLEGKKLKLYLLYEPVYPVFSTISMF